MQGGDQVLPFGNLVPKTTFERTQVTARRAGEREGEERPNDANVAAGEIRVNLGYPGLLDLNILLGFDLDQTYIFQNLIQKFCHIYRST